MSLLFANPLKPVYGIVGQGRLGKHLVKYFASLNLDFVVWDYKSTRNLEVVFENVEIVLLAIPDKTIDLFLTESPKLQKKVCIHFSGALVSRLAFGFHPLMTFNNEIYSDDVYKSILFVQDKKAPSFKDLFPELPNQYISIDERDKAYYHALCVLANNFTTILWQKFFYEMKNRFLASDKTLEPFIKQTMINIMKDPEKALTGPLVRNDEETISKNLKALDKDPFKEIYQSFVETYQVISNENRGERNDKS
ncbi:Rossmann-like and DUF2520 domain-containing protein [Francisella frigiditurris]|uniref:DUF2520 domain-containing protein n=1 Tax=Francisella frigiditurris TaxID=1542390 RepID=A0A1J0KUY1_9GAMM|nr:Rossmann-like and DUF2520 domain-containing protein [Francisella frigiditurris]APC97624.1 hypothetical protein KX01_947 [Francisella frigiditurris]